MGHRSFDLLASARGRIGGYAVGMSHDRRDLTAAGRAAFLASFARSVDPDGLLPPEVRERRARAARKAYFARLAYLSAKSRKGRAA